MKKLLVLLAAVLLIPAISCAQEARMQRVLIFPFKVITPGVADSYSNELAAALGAELAREGDVETISGQPFVSAIQERRIDPARIARLVTRADTQIAIWATVTKLESGYSLELNALQPAKSMRPRLFSADAKDMEELLSRMKAVSADVGTVILNRPKIGEIKIEGNKRIQREAILNKLDMKTGKPFRRSALGDEIRELYSMGYFDDVQIQAEETGKGEMDLRIILKERPSIKSVETEGNKVFNKDEILDTLTTKSFQVASLEKIQEDINKIKKMYEKKGYYQPKIDYEIKELSANEAQLIFKIDEGQKSFLTQIEYEGRQKLPEDELKKAMNIKEKSWFWSQSYVCECCE